MPSRALLPGPVLLGFADFFEAAQGDPRTPQPYPRVVPSAVSGVLLPFRCPHCGKVRPEAVDPRKRGGYGDPARGFSWCPACGGRYVLDGRGTPLAEALPPGAACAPAKVERGGKVAVLPESEASRLREERPERTRGGLALLGASR